MFIYNITEVREDSERDREIRNKGEGGRGDERKVELCCGVSVSVVCVLASRQEI